MSSTINTLSEGVKKILKNSIAKEAQTKRKENSERQKEINIQVRDLDPTSKLNQDLFIQIFEDYDNKNRDKTVKENLRNFLNNMNLDTFEGYLRRQLDLETKNILKGYLRRNSYRSGLYGYSSNVTKKENKDLKNYNAYYKYLHDNLSIPTIEEKKIKEKIKKLDEYTREKMNELSKLNETGLKKLLEKLIELGILKNLREKKNNATNPESSRIMVVINHLKSCEKEILGIILRDLNDIMLRIQSDFSGIKDKVVKKKLEKMDDRIVKLQYNKITNTNTTKSIKGIISSENFQSLDRLIIDYNKKLKNIKEIIEESQRKNPFKKKLRGTEAKVYKKADEAKKIIEKITNVLNKAKSKTSTSNIRQRPISSRPISPSSSSIFSKFHMLKRR